MPERRPLAVYVHWPFCRSKCPYCDFNSHVETSVDQDRWRAALLAELDHCANETEGRRAVSLYFGGGTPSRMEPRTVAALIAAVRERWPPVGDLEVTLEANPSSAAGLGAFLEAGVNRVSIGVQSLDDKRLAFLGRWHSAAEALAAVAEAARFPRHSFDLIYGLPGQTVDGWKAELARVLEIAGEHLSVYQLTVEPGTAFFAQGVEEAPEALAATLFEVTQDLLEGAGLPAYEVSNHARPGAECRHNLFCWRGGDYLGVGPGAHGRLADDGGGAWASHRIAAPDRWLRAVEDQGFGTAKTTRLSPLQRREEILMTGLRLTEGVEADRFAAAAGQSLEDFLDPARLEPLAEGGFIEWDGQGLRATPKGRLCLNAVIGKLLA